MSWAPIISRPALVKSLLILVIYLCTSVVSAESVGGDTLSVESEQFKRAYGALTKGKVTRAKELIQGLENYPLYVYFRYYRLSRRLYKASKQEVRDFLSAYDESLLADRLRTDWLSFLGRTKQWTDYLHDYRPQSRTKLKCVQLRARIETGALEGVLGDTRALWLVGKSQPDECDPAFEYLKASKMMDDQLVWQRIRLALNNNKRGLARYLSRMLQNSDLREAADHRLAVHADPFSGLKKPFFSQDDLLVREIVAHAIARIARRNVDRAVAAWKKYALRYQFDAHERGRVRRSLGVAAASRNHDERIALLDQIPAASVDDIVEKYRIRAAIKENAWEELVRWTDNAPVGETDSLRWRYWRARALENLNRREQAESIFRELAKHRDYYGFLSADRVNLDYQMNHHPIVADEVEIAEMMGRPGILRARELFRLKMYFKARGEWQHEVGQLSARQLEVAAYIVNTWGWYDRAILALGKARSYDDLEIRFPVRYEQLVRRYAAKRGLDASVLYSIIRTESAFMEDARSPAGALGLMQIMPATGRETARRIGAKLASARDLLDPGKNVTIGSAYLKEMLGRFGDSFSMAAAAYNAGPHRVRSWRPKSGCVPADIWIDTIPFTETRRYVRRASFYATVYQWRLEERIEPLANRLTSVAARGAKQQC